MKVELDPEELDLILEALHDKHVACSESIDFLPKVRAVNRLYNRLIELSEEHHTSRLETFAKGLAKEALHRAAKHDLSLQADCATVVKERNGQVKTTEERQDNGADNEMDGEDAIKLYKGLREGSCDKTQHATLTINGEPPSTSAFASAGTR